MAELKDTTQKGVSSDEPNVDAPKEALKERPFPEPKPEEKPAVGEKTQHAQAVEDMADRVEAQRVKELDEALKVDPGLKAQQDDLEAGQLPVKDSDDVAAEIAAKLKDGVPSHEPMEEPIKEDPSALPEELQDDPLAEYIVMKDGRPHMRLKVDGEDKFLDLDRARATVQKHESADIRLQQVASWHNELQNREANVLRAEEALRVRPSQPDPSSAEALDVGDTDLKKRSAEVIKSVFSGTEEEAIEGLTAFAEDIQRQTRTSVPQVDVDAIGRQAVAVAKQELQAGTYIDAVNVGWTDFQEEYPDIMADKNQFLHADAVAETLVKEFPNWAPKKVMMESGKRTREWVESLTDPSGPSPSSEDISRQDAKTRLQRVPQPSTARRESESEEVPETPQQVVAKMRAARNQPT